MGAHGNLMNKDTRRRIKELISSGKCLGVWFGFPCGTFSRARRHDGKGTPPLRGNCPRTLKGLPGLKPSQRKRVLSANKLLFYTYELCSLCMKHKVPFYLENPRSSRVWLWPTVKKLLRDKATTALLVDYCQYGTDYKKPTQVLCWGNSHITKADCRLCKGKGGFCSMSKKQHEKLDGRPSDATNGEWKTTIACPYPLGFCEHLAPLIVAPYRDTFCTTRAPDASEGNRSSSARIG